MRRRVRTILKRLASEYPDAKTALSYTNEFELLVAVILSAQCTDVRVNAVTPRLFARYPRIEDYANASLRELEDLIRPTGYYKQKAKRIKACAHALIEHYDGRIPRTLADLTSLPGVGRKTANVVLQNVHGVLEGIVVDTHVRRVARRLGLTTHTDPVRIEEDLMRITPPSEYQRIADLLIFHGRAVCVAIRPRCPGCVLKDICPYPKQIATH